MNLGNSKGKGPALKDNERGNKGRERRILAFRLRGQANRPFPKKATPRVLLLQGPVGSFFGRTQDHLNASGFDCWRVCFNSGDRLFSRRHKTLNFGSSPDNWRSWFVDLVRENGFDFVILFGAERPVHRVAIDACEDLRVPVLCLEEGYLRPGYVTMEFGGNNWRSPIAGRLPPQDFQSPRHEGPKPVNCSSSFSAMAWSAFQYFTVRALFSTPNERRLFHKQKRTLVTEALYWVKNYYRKFSNVGHNYRISERLLEHHDGRYFLVPLQVHDDSQLGVAARSWNNQKLILKTIVSFARHAPQSHHLVFKIHPMERGHTRDRQLIRQVAALNNVEGRVHVLDGGSIGLLTRHSAGMITINSTSGLSALHHGVPLAVLGNALYRHPELAFCSENGRDLDLFWTAGQVAPVQQRQNYLSWILHSCLAGGDFYAREGIDAAAQAIENKLREALDARNAALAAAEAEAGEGAEVVTIDFQTPRSNPAGE